MRANEIFGVRPLHFRIIPASALLVAVLTACAPGATPTVVVPTIAPVASPAATPPATGATMVSGTPASSTATAVATATGPGAVMGDAAAGRAVFQANCDSCHPAGRAGAGPALSGVVDRLGVDGVRSVVRNGRPGTAMPGFPSSRITDQQLTDLVAYLNSL